MVRRNDGQARRDDRAVYIISVAAELAGVHPQTLRFYERKGLLSPKRTAGNTRRYSDRDIERLQEIQDLTQSRGVNLAGAKLIIEMQAELESLRRQMDELERRLRASRRLGYGARDDRESVAIVPLRSVFLPPWRGNTAR
jgi:MerR family transcriptional regulator/heat shock protein HspR